MWPTSSWGCTWRWSAWRTACTRGRTCGTKPPGGTAPCVKWPACVRSCPARCRPSSSASSRWIGSWCCRFHFQSASAHLACALTWGDGSGHGSLAARHGPLELLRPIGHLHPAARHPADVPRPAYSFGVMIVFNFLLFLLIAVGQGFIYWSVNVGRTAVHDSSRRSKDLTIARRLITVAVSDFLCWFPIGLLGILASNGSPVPGEVNVATAIIVLPVNSALIPFLYTLNTILPLHPQHHPSSTPSTPSFLYTLSTILPLHPQHHPSSTPSTPSFLYTLNTILPLHPQHHPSSTPSTPSFLYTLNTILPLHPQHHPSSTPSTPSFLYTLNTTLPLHPQHHPSSTPSTPSWRRGGAWRRGGCRSCCWVG